MSGVMFLAGVGIPIMAALNATLGARIGPPAAAAILFAVGFICAMIMVVVTGGTDWSKLSTTPLFLFGGGLLVAFYILSITTLAPRMGVATAVLFVLLGQLVTAALIDQFGLFGAPKIPLTPTRIFGFGLMVVSILMAKR